MERRRFLEKSILASTGIIAVPSIDTWWQAADDVGGHAGRGVLATEDIRVLVLEGSARMRGQIHGEALKDKITELVELWKEAPAARFGSPDTYIREFLRDTSFTDAIARWTPDLLDEVRGISEGSGVDHRTMLAYQLVDEEWWYGRNRLYGVSPPEAEKCSVVGVYGQSSRPPLVAQNMDIPSYTDGHHVVLHVKHNDSPLESYVLTYPGLVSLNGLNNHSIGVCVNAVLQLNQRVDGLPVAFINRGILAQSTFGQAVEFVRRISHASGQTYTIGGSEEVASFECSANRVVPFAPYEGATRLYHTNHPLVNDDQSTYRELLEKSGSGRRSGPGNSEIRYEALARRLRDPSGPITVESVKSILSSHDDPRNPVCNHRREDGTGGFTYACTIMELSDNPTLHVSQGPPCSRLFSVLRF